MSATEFADALAHSMEERTTLLKIMAMNHYNMEENTRMERLVEFKATYGRSLAVVRSGLEKCWSKGRSAENTIPKIY